MAGVWEALFYEEKQDWMSCIVNSVFTVANLALELPCTILALVSTALIMSWELTCQGAQQVSDLLGLESWWSLEHTLWTVLFLQSLPIFCKRAAGDKGKLLLQVLFLVQVISAFGALLFLVNGLQGGVVFGGKLFHPNLAVLAVLTHCMMTFMRGFKQDVAGVGHDKKVDNERFNSVNDMYEKFMKLEVAMYLCVATFGMPQFDLNGDPTTWLVALPLLGMIYDYQSVTDALCPPEKTESNGAPPQVVEEAKADEAKKAEEPAKKEEEKKDESKDDKKEEEAKPAAEEEVKKASVLTQAVEFVGAIYGKVVSFNCCVLSKVCGLVTLVKDKILSLPWACLVNLLTTVGVTMALTFARWTLTEDNLVFVAPAVQILGPCLLQKFQEKEWLDAKGAHLTSEILNTAHFGIHYYLFRTYISMPF